MPISTFDDFLQTLPDGTPVEVATIGYGVRHVTGAYRGWAPGETGSIVIENQGRHVVDVRRVQSVCCPVTGADAAAERLDQSVPERAQVVLSTTSGAAHSGAYEGIGGSPRRSAGLGRNGGSTSVPLDEVSEIGLELR